MSLEIKGLCKRYHRGIQALDHISLTIGPGMFGLLGPNGAGKSTLMRILACLQRPDAGSIRFREIDILERPYELRRQLGYLPQSFGLYPNERGRSLLLYLAALKGIASRKQRHMIVDELLERTNLTDVQHKRLGTYSGGMKQRFGIAQLLLNRPKLIIVDEPTAGLDPFERRRFLNVLRSIGTDNTVIFSTHIVEDVSALCNDMAIIKRGRILRHDAPQRAMAALQGCLWQKAVEEAELPALEQAHLLLSRKYGDGQQQWARIFAKNRPGEGFRSVAPTIEDVYFLTLKKANDV